MILKNKENLYSSIRSFISNTDNVTIMAAYIKLDTLKKLLDDIEHKVSRIVVRWEARDLIGGASDLEVYDFCKKNEISLFRNPNLHLKSYIDFKGKCIITSANISGRALGLHPNRFNYEIGTESSINLDDKIYFNNIIHESTLITDEIYQHIKAQLKDIEIAKEPQIKFNFAEKEKGFLVSSLPMSYSFQNFKSSYFNRTFSNITTENCFIHDLVLYQIPKGLTESKLKSIVKERFFEQVFTQAISYEIITSGNRGINFGRIKEWIQRNCTNVPIPRRWEITENVQILYRWITELDSDYVVDMPGRRSERIRYLVRD